MRPVPVPATELHKWRDKIHWHLESFSENGIYAPEDFIADIKDRRRQLWLVVDNGAVECVLLTSIADDRLKTCLVTHCAGRNFHAWVHLFGVVEDWAKAEGCKRIEAKTRPGWERILKRFDLKKTHVVLEKRL